MNFIGFIEVYNKNEQLAVNFTPVVVNGDSNLDYAEIYRLRVKYNLEISGSNCATFDGVGDYGTCSCSLSIGKLSSILFFNVGNKLFSQLKFEEKRSKKCNSIRSGRLWKKAKGVQSRKSR